MAQRESSAEQNNKGSENAAVSIYTVSRTHGKALSKWTAILKQIEEEAPFRGQSYAPFRAAIIALLRGSKSAEELLNDGFEVMLSKTSARWQQRIVKTMWKKSARAFERFASEIAERFGDIHDIYEQPGRTNYVDFNDVPIKGRFHFSADFDGTKNYVYLVGGDWDKTQTLAFSELLTVIAAEAHEAPRENVLLIDLTLDSPLVRPKKSAVRLRNELLNEARNLRRLIRAISQE